MVSLDFNPQAPTKDTHLLATFVTVTRKNRMKDYVRRMRKRFLNAIATRGDFNDWYIHAVHYKVQSNNDRFKRLWFSVLWVFE